MTYDSIDELVLDSVNKTRPMPEREFWERLERNGKRGNAMILIPQIEGACKRLIREGKLNFVTEGGVKKIVRT